MELGDAAPIEELETSQNPQNRGLWNAVGLQTAAAHVAKGG